MKFSVSHAAIRAALSSVVPAAKAGDDVLSLTVAGSRLTVVGSSGNFTVKIDVPVKDAEDGSVVVPATFFSSVANRLNSDEIKVATANAGLSVSSGKASFSVRTITGVPVNAIQIPQSEPVSVTGDLIDAMQQVAVAAAKNTGVAPAITGVLLSASSEKVDVVATDSYRVAVRTLEASALPVAAKAVIPAPVIGILGSLMAGRKDLTVRLGDISASFHTEGAVLVTRLIDGTFPQYQKVIPAAEGTIVKVDRDVMKEILTRAALVNKSRVSVSLTEGAVSVSSNSSEHGDYAESFAAETTGDDVTFAVNPQYVVDGLQAAPGADIEVVCASGTKPVLIQAKDSDSFRYVVMPVRV